jgi:hypothetical protein
MLNLQEEKMTKKQVDSDHPEIPCSRSDDDLIEMNSEQKARLSQ